MTGMKVVTETSDNVYADFSDADYRYKGRKYRVQFRRFALVFGPTQAVAARLTVGRRFSPDYGMRVIGVARCDGRLPFCAANDTIVLINSLPVVRGHSAKKRTWSAVADSFISTFALVPHTVVLNKAPTQPQHGLGRDTGSRNTRHQHPCTTVSPLVAILEWMTKNKARKCTRSDMDTRTYMHERRAAPADNVTTMHQTPSAYQHDDETIQGSEVHMHINEELERSKAAESGIMLLMDFAKSTSNLNEYRPIHLVGT
jgi:hypothetical protein